MENLTKPKGNPLHEVCKTNVEKPTLVHLNKNDYRVWLQWHGQSELFDLFDKQFLFPVSNDTANFFEQPESFEVIMVGPIKNWPNKNVVGNLVAQCGGEDVIIIYFISSKFSIDGGNSYSGQIPAAGILPITTLADMNCGFITPKEFFDDTVRTEAIKRFGSEN